MDLKPRRLTFEQAEAPAAVARQVLTLLSCVEV
jgi:hypothetical protein